MSLFIMNFEENLKEKTEQLIKLIGVNCTVNINKVEENYNVVIEGDEANILVGYRGEVLESIQHILSLMVRDNEKETGRVIVDASGYRELRNKALEELAKTTADKVRFTGKPIELSPMSSYERRLVHMFIADQEGVESGSIDEREYRRVIVSPVSTGTKIEE